MKSSKTSRIISATVMYIILVTVALISLFPIIYVIAASFKTNAEIMAHPEALFPMQPTIDNYKTALGSGDFNIPRMFLNSTYYTVVCVTVVILLASMGGYVFERGEFRGKKTLFIMFSALMFINIGSITIYPLFDVLNIIHLSSSLNGLVVMKIFGINIIQIYLVKGFVSSIPKALDESAEIDGCGFFQTFLYIIFPMLKPIIATIGILAFQGSWNEYLMPTLFTLTRPEQRTLIVGVLALKTSGESASSWNLMLAGTTVALIPVLIAYSFGNKYFVKGIASGAVKG